MLSNISTILGLILITVGMLTFALEMIGINRYQYLLNRMHAAGTGDTLGLFSCLLGLIFISGLNFTSLKLGLVILFLWFASPTASHLIAKLETSTNEEISKHVDIQIDEEELSE